MLLAMISSSYLVYIVVLLKAKASILESEYQSQASLTTIEDQKHYK